MTKYSLTKAEQKAMGSGDEGKDTLRRWREIRHEVIQNYREGRAQTQAQKAASRATK